jgi:hypothetical protein
MLKHDIQLQCLSSVHEEYTGCLYWQDVLEACTGNLSPNFETFKEPKNRFHGINSASLCSLAGQYDNPIPNRFLAPTDYSKIPELYSVHTVDLYWRSVLAAYTFGLYWRHVLAACTGGMYWRHVLAACTGGMYWRPACKILFSCLRS